MSRTFPWLLALLLATAGCGENEEGSDENQGGASGAAGAAGSGSGASGGSGGTAGSSGASGSATGGSGGSRGEFCGGLTVSGLVRFEIEGETLLVGTMNDEFFAEAQRLLETGERRVPVFNTLHDGRRCDAQWSWHPDPTDMEFADFTIELCDGLPSYVEQNKTEWFASVGTYCPWSARVTETTIVDPP